MPTTRALAVLLLAILLVGCGSSAPATFGDTQRVWCGAHPVAVVTAGGSLSVSPSRFVVHKAALEQASIDGDQQQVTSLQMQWLASEMTATDSDPHPNVNAMQSWELDAAADWQRACMAAWDAGKSQ